MKKIPTLFLRSEDRRSVINEVNPGCEWVLAGEGTPTRKWDGTCCMVRDGILFKRREIKPGKTAPDNFELTEHDPVTGKSFGWVPVGDGPEDAIYREAFHTAFGDATYELVGPKVNGNPEGLAEHELIPHGMQVLMDDPRTFDAISTFCLDHKWEGIVWHHPDGRRAKIKRRDFILASV